MLLERIIYVKILYIFMKFVKENIMNNIFKKLKISLVIVGIVVGVGYLANNGGNNIEKDNTNESINNSNESINNSNEVLLSKLDK